MTKSRLHYRTHPCQTFFGDAFLYYPKHAKIVFARTGNLTIEDIPRLRSRSLFVSRCEKKNDPENESMPLTLFTLVLMSKPSTKAVPPDIISSPVNILNVVVFPAPLIPRRPKHSLMGIPRLKRSTATNGPRPGGQTKDTDVSIIFQFLATEFSC